MEKLLRNIHWILILLAAFEFYQNYTTSMEREENLNNSLDVQKRVLDKNKKTQRDIQNYYNNIKDEKDKIERVALEIEKMQQLLPSYVSDNENILLLRSMATDVNIKEITISPEIESNRGFYIANRYKIKAKATFLQFLILFEKIGENQRILNIGEALFVKTPEPQRGKFQTINGEFIIESYRYNSDYKEDRGIDKIEKSLEEKKNSDSGEEASAVTPESDAGPQVENAGAVANE